MGIAHLSKQVDGFYGVNISWHKEKFKTWMNSKSMETKQMTCLAQKNN